MAGRAAAESIRSEALRPSAEEVDTYVKPAKVDDGSENLRSLAQGLSKMDAGLGSFMEERQRSLDEDAKLQAEADFYANNAIGFNEAVRQGKIPAFASRAYVQAYQGVQGQVDGYGLDAKFKLAQSQLDVSKMDLPAYNAWVQKFTKENLPPGTDPAVLRGLLPRIRSLSEQGLNQFVADKDKATKKQAGDAQGALVNETIEEDRRNNLVGGKPFDPVATGAKLAAARQAAVGSGMTEQQADTLYVDAVTRMAVEKRDPTILKLLDAPVPGQKYAYKDTPYGAPSRDQAITKLEELGRRGISEEKRLSDAADKKALDDIQRRVQDSIQENPSAPIPEELIRQGQKFDGTFRTTAEGWRRSMQEGKGREDKEEVLSVYADIYRGAGAAAITNALRNGVVKDPDTLKSLRNEVEKVGKAGGDVDKILDSSSAKAITKEIQTRLATGTIDVFGNTNMTNAALTAQMDYRKALLDWRIKNPEADTTAQIDAANTIGASILKNIQGDGMTGGEYNRPKGAGPAPFDFKPPEGAGPATPLAQPPAATPAPKPASPTNFGGSPGGAPRLDRPVPGPSVAPSADPAVKKSWYDAIPLEQKAQIETAAAKQGVTPEVLSDRLFTLAAAREDPAVVLAQRRVRDTLGGPPGDDLASQITAAFTDESGPADPATVQRIARAFQDAFSSPAPAGGDYSLAAIKDMPKAARILDFISGPESTGNYNAYFAHAGSTKDLSKMSVAEVMDWMSSRGTVSSATGRYQFMKGTLAGLVKRLGVDVATTKFTPEFQDRLAVQLLKDRGYDDWAAGKVDDAKFANRLALEWASLPNFTPQRGRGVGQSAYQGDGLNKALVSTGKVQSALDEARELPAQAATTQRVPPVIYGDSLGEGIKQAAGGLDGDTKVSRQPLDTSRLIAEAPKAKAKGQPMFISSVSNNPEDGVARLPTDIGNAKQKGYTPVVFGVGSKFPAAVNERIEKVASEHGALFVPLPEGKGMRAADGVHLTKKGYAAAYSAADAALAAPESAAKVAGGTPADKKPEPSVKRGA